MTEHESDRKSTDDAGSRPLTDDEAKAIVGGTGSNSDPEAAARDRIAQQLNAGNDNTIMGPTTTNAPNADPSILPPN